MPTVETSLGSIQGRERDGVEQYLGIRYAQAPVGDLRFRAPVPVEPWDGAYDATRLGTCAPQAPRAADSPLPSRDIVCDEDCLFLNVYTPGSDDARRPVLFWIHGGAYTRGSGDTTDGTSFAARGDIVVVTINYRLGALGFMELGHLDETLSGSQNNGIRDQITALKWVHDHIAAFGGDPEQVTICGESAGAGSVMAVLASPSADALFHRAISQSAPAGFREAEPGAAEDLLSHLGGGGLDRLRTASVDELVEAQEAAAAAGAGDGRRIVLFGNSGRGFRPAVDGHTVTRTAVDAVAAAGAAAKPLMVGTNLDEGTLFSFSLPGDITDDEVRVAVKAHADDADAVFDAFAAAYPGDSNRRRMVHMQGDTMFRLPSLRFADAQIASGGGAVYTYLFTFQAEGFGGRMGAMHALEIPFVWNQDLSAWGALVGDADPGDLADRMHRAWIAFVRSGDPNHDGIPQWPAYDSDRRPTMEFGPTSRVLDDPAGSTRAAWG